MTIQIQGILEPIKTHTEQVVEFELNDLIGVWFLVVADFLLPAMRAMIYKQVVITGERISEPVESYGRTLRVDHIGLVEPVAAIYPPDPPIQTPPVPIA